MSDESEDDTTGHVNSKRIPPETWTEIERLYETGEANGVELSARYGVSSPTLSKRFRSKGIIAGSKKPGYVAPGAPPAVAALPPRKTWAELKEERIEETKRRSYEIHAAVGTMMTNILRQIGTGAAKASDKIGELKALNLMAKTNEITRVGRYVLLDIQPDINEEGLPGILIEDLGPDEIEAIHKAQQEGFDPDNDDDIVIEEAVEDSGEPEGA